MGWDRGIRNLSSRGGRAGGRGGLGGRVGRYGGRRYEGGECGQYFFLNSLICMLLSLRSSPTLTLTFLLVLCVSLQLRKLATPPITCLKTDGVFV